MNGVEREHWVLIETSSEMGEIGLARGDSVLATHRLDQAQRHARDLAPSVRQLLQPFNLEPRDCRGVVVSLGPGSYTGLRVGISSAKGLAYAIEGAVIGIPSFQAVAQTAALGEGIVHVVGDALKNKLFWQAFACAGTASEPQALGAMRIVPGAELATVVGPSGVLCGAGQAIARRWLPAEGYQFLDACRHPSIEALWQLARTRVRAGQTDEIATLEPLYQRPSSAEEQWTR